MSEKTISRLTRAILSGKRFILTIELDGKKISARGRKTTREIREVFQMGVLFLESTEKEAEKEGFFLFRN